MAQVTASWAVPSLHARAFMSALAAPALLTSDAKSDPLHTFQSSQAPTSRPRSELDAARDTKVGGCRDVAQRRGHDQGLGFVAVVQEVHEGTEGVARRVGLAE
eukprot:scaffold274587_cov40-Prasinocladus_malaysianus.AAC.1